MSTGYYAENIILLSFVLAFGTRKLFGLIAARFLNHWKFHLLRLVLWLKPSLPSTVPIATLNGNL